jgi:hypothetical protein
MTIAARTVTLENGWSLSSGLCFPFQECAVSSASDDESESLSDVEGKGLVGGLALLPSDSTPEDGGNELLLAEPAGDEDTGGADAGTSESDIAADIKTGAAGGARACRTGELLDDPYDVDDVDVDVDDVGSLNNNSLGFGRGALGL